MKRKIDLMTDQDIEDYFMATFDCYADSDDVIPAMSQKMYLKTINELLQEVKGE